MINKEYIQYMTVGIAALATLAILTYLQPLVFFLTGIVICMWVLSFVAGYIIVDTYKVWRYGDDQNKSGKKAPSSKDVG